MARNNDLESIYPCGNPINRYMRNYETRLGTFLTWDRPTVQAQPEEIAEAGFFYMEERDRVKCWYCNGGLHNWVPEDVPWFEHAKWFPLCEYLLRKKGSQYVCEITAQFPDLRRPPLRNPSLNETTRIVQNLCRTITRNPSLREVMSSIQRFSVIFQTNDVTEAAPEDAVSCGVCFVNKIDTVILVCGHAYCASCVKRTPDCAFCRKPVKYTHPLFLPFYVPK